MKTFFKVVLFVFVAALYSCGKDEVSSASSSITSGGVISGTISNYTTNPVDSITFDGDFFGKVNNDGKFSFTLLTPKTSYLEELGSVSGLTVSDPKALFNGGYFLAIPYSKGTAIGYIMKLNSNSKDDSSVGVAFSMFIYVDRDVTVKGAESNIRNNSYSVWDVKFKKGWNEIVVTITKVSGTVITYSISSNIPSGLKWVAVTGDTAGTASKVKALKSLLKK